MEGMQESEFDDIMDDWFIESLKTYKDLHVFQLEHPTQVIEWTSGKTVCVSGFDLSKNEILELRLPLKLFADENKGLCAERDFKVTCGGFTDGPVRCLKHIPGTRSVVTADGLSSNLTVWELGGDDRDVIRRTGTIEGKGEVSESCSRMAARLSSPPQVLHGSHSNNIQLTQLGSGQTLYSLEADSADPLSSLQFVSDSVFLAGCCNGNIYVADIRTSAAPQVSPPPPSPGDPAALWWTDVSAGPDPSSCRAIRLSSSGRALVSDWRNLGGVLCQAQLEVQTTPSSPHDVTVCWAPTMDDCFSVSGFSGGVQIYNTSAWRTEPQEVEPLFKHKGHEVSSQQSAGVLVTAHAWHPERARTLLSAASDGSLHVWDWVHPDQSAT